MLTALARSSRQQGFSFLSPFMRFLLWLFANRPRVGGFVPATGLFRAIQEENEGGFRLPVILGGESVFLTEVVEGESKREGVKQAHDVVLGQPDFPWPWQFRLKEPKPPGN